MHKVANGGYSSGEDIRGALIDVASLHSVIAIGYRIFSKRRVVYCNFHRVGNSLAARQLVGGCHVQAMERGVTGAIVWFVAEDGVLGQDVGILHLRIGRSGRTYVSGTEVPPLIQLIIGYHTEVMLSIVH